MSNVVYKHGIKVASPDYPFTSNTEVEVLTDHAIQGSATEDEGDWVGDTIKTEAYFYEDGKNEADFHHFICETPVQERSEEHLHECLDAALEETGMVVTRMVFTEDEKPVGAEAFLSDAISAHMLMFGAIKHDIPEIIKALETGVPVDRGTVENTNIHKTEG